MNTNQPITDDLLGKYLSRETNEQENALVENWLKENDSNKKQLLDYQFITNEIDKISLKEQQSVDVDAAWEKVQKKISNKGKVVEFKPKQYFNVSKIAASVSLFLMAGLLIYLVSKKSVETIAFETTNFTTEKTLPDGSIITLNKNSKLTYSADFQGDTREVSLEGEAFFDIKRDESKPFVIHAKGSEIKVLGTSFNVKAYNEAVKVSVETGKVSFKRKKIEQTLTKGEEAEWVSQKDTIVKRLILDKNTMAYKTHVYVFEDKSLDEILKVLSEGYQVPILLKNSSLKYCKLTTKFDNETLPNTLNIIAETLNLRLSKENETYYFDGECR